MKLTDQGDFTTADCPLPALITWCVLFTLTVRRWI